MKDKLNQINQNFNNCKPILMGFVILFVVFCKSAYAQSDCLKSLLYKDVNWTQRLEKLNKLGSVELYKKTRPGKFIETENSLFRYTVSGENSIRPEDRKYIAYFGGLGDSLEKSVEAGRMFFKNYEKLGFHIIVVEYEGQGDVEVIRNYQKRSDSIISTSHLRAEIPLGLSKILENENIQQNQLSQVVGLSFGGQLVLGIQSEAAITNRVVALASGVSNYNNFLYHPLDPFSDYITNFIKRFSDLMVSEQALNIALKFAVSFFKFREETIINEGLAANADPVLYAAKASLTLGARSLDIRNEIGKVNSPTELILVSSLKDDVVPGMLHFETAEKAMANKNIIVKLILVEGLSHHIPQKANSKVAEALAKLTTVKSTGKHEVYLVKKTGNFKKITFAVAKSKLKNQTRRWWKNIESILAETFPQVLSHRFGLPRKWMENNTNSN